jgi:hypothetical protein
MRYYKRLYIGNNVGDDTLKRLKDGQETKYIYALCVCDKTVGMLEILSLHELLKPRNAERDYAVIALVRGSDSAYNAVADLIKAWLSSHKDLSGLKAYYNKNSL